MDYKVKYNTIFIYLNFNKVPHRPSNDPNWPKLEVDLLNQEDIAICHGSDFFSKCQGVLPSYACKPMWKYYW